jgi:hypothetical protein
MPCRLCTANDREALIEDLAAKFWAGERDDALDGRTWAQAGSYWQPIFRRFAGRPLAVMEQGRSDGATGAR